MSRRLQEYANFPFFWANRNTHGSSLDVVEGPGKKIKQGNEIQSINYEVEVEKASEGAQHLPGAKLQSSRTK